MCKDLRPDDILSRFLPHKKHFSVEKNCVKPSAFRPNKKNLQLSTSVTSGLSESETWSLCLLDHFYGRGDLEVGAFLSLDLIVDRDDNPPRHVNITDWPHDKASQKSLAQQLAARAKLVLYQSP